MFTRKDKRKARTRADPGENRAVTIRAVNNYDIFTFFFSAMSLQICWFSLFFTDTMYKISPFICEVVPHHSSLFVHCVGLVFSLFLYLGVSALATKSHHCDL